jgi:hypothetical protein
MPRGLAECPACGAAIPPAAPAAPPRSTKPDPAAAAEAAERLTQLERWRTAAETLDVVLPVVPRWVETRIRKEPDAGWIAFLEEVERTARTQMLEALKAWEKRTLGRLQRLESYSIDDRLEREQVEDAVSAARGGEIARSLAVVQQVDRVLSLKERHLDVAREELERLIDLVRDLRALGIDVPYDPKELSDELEGELRAGRLAPLKGQLRALRLEIVRLLKGAFPVYVARYGEHLARERAGGREVTPQIAELVRCSKAYSEGRPDEAVQRLRRLRELPVPPTREVEGAARDPVGPYRTISNNRTSSVK